MPYSLRPYQQEVVDYALPRLQKSDKPLLMSLSVAMGKTWCIAETAKRWDGNVLVLTLSKELCEQDYEKLCIVAGEENVGMYSASWNKKEIKPITVATIQSAYRHPEFWENYNLLILDECEVMPVDGMLSALVKGKKVFGLTATAYGTSGSYSGLWYTTKLYPLHKIKSKTMGWFWQPVEMSISEKRLTEEGYLCPLKIFASPIDCSALKINSNGSEYVMSSVEEWVNGAFLRIIELMKGAEKNNMCKSGIVFLPSVASCEALEALCEREGISARAVSSKTPKKKREKIIDSHKDGSLRWLLNMGIATRGFDNPQVDCLIIARPTKSLRLHRQCLSEDTEILTADGWKKMGEIKIGDKLPNFNLETQQGDWDEVLDIVERKTQPDEQWVEYDGQSHNFKVTDGHNLLYKKNHQSNYTLKRAGSITSSFCAPTTIQLSKRGVFVNDFWEGPRLATPTEMWLIGMLLTDGHWRVDENGEISQVRLAQSSRHSYILDRIHQSCRECNIKYRKTRTGKIGDERTIFGRKTQRNYDMFEYSLPKTDIDYLTPLLDKTASWVKDATREQLLALLDGLFDGNGSKKLTVKDYVIRTRDFCHPNKELVDNINIACVTNGIQSHVKTQKTLNSRPLYRLYYCPTKTFRTINPPTKTEIATNSRKHRWLEKSPCSGEKCWCVETKNGTILTRRNGYVTVMGNCLGRGVRLAEGKSVCTVIDLTENCKTWGGSVDVEMGKKGWQDTILLRGHDISGMEVAKINIDQFRKPKDDEENNITRKRRF